MPDYCSLCGDKIPFFSTHSLVCANQDELFCSKCHDKLYPMENLDRGAYLLEHGKPEHPEKMREFIIQYTERTKKKQELEPPTRTCPNCGGEMTCKIKDFTIGLDGNGGLYLFGGPQQYDVDLYACPECGKVEMYTANFTAVKRRVQQAAAKQAEREAAAEKARQVAEQAPVQQEFISVRSGGKRGEKPPWEK